jgi:hypothetical protein
VVSLNLDKINKMVTGSHGEICPGTSITVRVYSTGVETQSNLSHLIIL